MKKFHYNITAAVALVLMLSGVMAAHAVPTLRISSGMSSVLIQDNGFGDNDSDAFSVLAVSQAVGNWALTVTVGTVIPYAGLTGTDFLHMNVYAAATPGAEALTVEFSDDGGLELSPDYTMQLSANVAAGNTLFVGNYYGDELFTDDYLSSSLMFDNSNGQGTTAFADSAPGTWTTPAWTMRAILTPSAQGGSSSWDESKVPDGGSTVMLLGSVLAALGMVKRFKARS